MPNTYLLLPMRRWNSLQFGTYFQVGARTRWDITLTVGKVTSPGSVSVVIETSTTSQTNDWTALFTFPTQSSIGSVVATTHPAITDAPQALPDFTIDPLRDLFIRARITSLIPDIIVEVRATSPFFDIEDTSHLALLSQETRGWKDGLTRTVERSEDQVVELLLRDPVDGELDMELTNPGAADSIRKEIALQADYNVRRAMLERTQDPTSLVTLRGMSILVPGLERRLQRYRPQHATAWLGR